MSTAVETLRRASAKLRHMAGSAPSGQWTAHRAPGQDLHFGWMDFTCLTATDGDEVRNLMTDQQPIRPCRCGRPAFEWPDGWRCVVGHDVPVPLDEAPKGGAG